MVDLIHPVMVLLDEPGPRMKEGPLRGEAPLTARVAGYPQLTLRLGTGPFDVAGLNVHVT